MRGLHRRLRRDGRRDFEQSVQHVRHQGEEESPLRVPQEQVLRGSQELPGADLAGPVARFGRVGSGGFAALPSRHLR